MTKYPMTKAAILCALLLSCAQLALADAPTLAPNYWQQRMFFIPYQVNRQDPAYKAVAKVELLLSRDGATDWRVLDEAQPNVQAFSYLAPEDGEYWFALRHLDGRGQPWPTAAVQPQMRVVVDTLKPELELSGSLDAAGAIVVRYEAHDTNLRPESLVLETRPAGGSWTPTSPGQPDVTHIDRMIGRASWNPPPGATTIEVRGTILDKAGFRTEAQTQIAIANPPSPSALPSNSAADPFCANSPASTQDWPADNKLPLMPLPPIASAEPATGLNHLPPPEANPYSKTDSTEPTWRTPARLVGENPGDPHLEHNPFTAAGASEQPASLPPVDGIRAVNSKTFDVEYDLNSVGTWGVSKVELWGTRDDGRTWQSFAVDTDNRSPLRVTVPAEGVYGFRILVDGAPNDGPESGDKPELVIAIDLQPPKVERFTAELGKENLAGQLLVHWSASDANLASQPITLFYSSFPSGPWTSIADRLENSGEHNWRLERHIPDRFYLKLEARDAAGNVAANQMSAPIKIERPQATGHLRGVKPVAP